MDFENIIFEVKDAIALITFNRPKAMNAMNPATFRELAIIIETCKTDNQIKAVVLTGAGDRAFVAGADITKLNKLGSAMEAMDFIELGHNTLRSLELLGKPVIAAINGDAIGLGLELALSCDLRIAVETSNFGLPHITIGLIPWDGGNSTIIPTGGKRKGHGNDHHRRDYRNSRGASNWSG